MYAIKVNGHNFKISAKHDAVPIHLNSLTTKKADNKIFDCKF